MKKSSNQARKIFYVALSVLLIFASCLSFVGSWFTDSKDVIGELPTPKIQPTIVYGDSYASFDSSYYWSSSSDDKDIYIKFDLNNNNVKNQICRVGYSVTWGTLTDGVWTPVKMSGLTSLAIKMKDLNSNWIIGNASVDFDKILADQGITDEEIAESGLSRAEIIASLTADMECPINYYYFNDIVNIDSTQILKVFGGFEFDTENFNQSDFAGLTAKISFKVESESVSNRVIGENSGEWIYNTDGSLREDGPSNEWIQNIREKKNLL